MDGLLIIDKPEGLTSHDVVSRVRRVLKTRRVGHTGTLDPFATGVLVILVGQATRLARFLDKDVKEYEAVVQLGSTTDTGDRTGAPGVECGLSDEDLARRVSTTDWDVIFSKFRGKIEQVPPMYSAKKVEGRKLYELARQGHEIERAAVPVTVYNLDLLPRTAETPASAITIRVVCSAGTYIRTLAEDIGSEAGVGAHLSELRRTRAGRFTIEQAATLERFEGAAEPAGILLPMNAAVEHLPSMTLSPERAAKAKNGLSSRTNIELDDGEAVQMLDEKGGLIAIGYYRDVDKSVQPKVVFG